MRWVHSEWFLMRHVFYVTEVLLSWLSWGTKGGIGYLLPQQWNKGLQLFTKVKCYFQDDEGPFVIMGILATRYFSDHTSLTFTFNLFLFFWVLFLFKFWSRPFTFTPICYFYGFLSSHEAHFIGERAICDNLQNSCLKGNSLVPHDLLKRSWLWKQMRDYSTPFLRHGSWDLLFSSEGILKDLPGGR